MHRPNAFSRFNVLITAMAALVAGTYGAMPGKVAANNEQALDMLGGYRSRGKGEGSRNRRAPGAGMAAQRASMKRRNVLRHRKACRS